MSTLPANKYHYTWKMIATMTVGFGVSSFVLVGLSTDWVFSTKMTAVVVVGVVAFGTYMRRVNPPQKSN